MNMREPLLWQPRWKIQRFRSLEEFLEFARLEALGDLEAAARLSFDTSDVPGNLLVNAGIALLEDLLIGAGGTVYSNANAYLGVGDSSTAEGASQTALQAASNKTYVGMSASYPQRASQTVTWRAAFGSGSANYAWQEFAIFNASAGGGTMLNRKVSSQGTKSSGQTWTLDLAVSIS